MLRQMKSELSSLVFFFLFGFSSRFPAGREACSEEATVQNLTGIPHVFFCVCVFFVCFLKREGLIVSVGH